MSNNRWLSKKVPRLSFIVTPVKEKMYTKFPKTNEQILLYIKVRPCVSSLSFFLTVSVSFLDVWFYFSQLRFSILLFRLHCRWLLLIFFYLASILIHIRAPLTMCLPLFPDTVAVFVCVCVAIVVASFACAALLFGNFTPIKRNISFEWI